VPVSWATAHCSESRRFMAVDFCTGAGQGGVRGRSLFRSTATTLKTQLFRTRKKQKQIFRDCEVPPKALQVAFYKKKTLFLSSTSTMRQPCQCHPTNQAARFIDKNSDWAKSWQLYRKAGWAIGHCTMRRRSDRNQNTASRAHGTTSQKQVTNSAANSAWVLPAKKRTNEWSFR